MEDFFARSDHMSCAYRHWQVRLPINFFNFYLLESRRFNTCVPGIHKSDEVNAQASLVMPVSDPRDRFLYPHHTSMKDTYYLNIKCVSHINLSLSSRHTLALSSSIYRDSFQ